VDVSDLDPIEFAAGDLDPAARAEGEARMRDDARFRDDVVRMREVLARIDALPADAWDPPAPPPLRLPAEATAPARPARARRARRRWSVSLPAPALALGAAALLAGGVAIGALVSGDDPAAPPVERRVALAALASAPDPPRGTARILAGNSLDLDVSGLAANRGGDFYSVWLLGDGGELVPLGSFRVGEGGAASLRVPLPQDPSRFAYVDVSREPADGDPRHSGDSVLRGATT